MCQDTSKGFPGPPTRQPIAGFISPGVTQRNPESYFDVASPQNVSRAAQGIVPDPPPQPQQQQQADQGDSGGQMPWYWPYPSAEAYQAGEG